MEPGLWKPNRRWWLTASRSSIPAGGWRPETGLDIIKAAILGAESFGFGTGPMVALGCKYLRICHLNNCATGAATQDDKLRKNHYHGLPFKVTNYFEFIARETRELMAELEEASGGSDWPYRPA